MKRSYRSKRIWVSKKRYVTVLLFGTLADMQEYYAKSRPQEQWHHKKTLGVHFPHKRMKFNEAKRWQIIPESGQILLNLEHCGAGIVCHELMHGVLWAWKHHAHKRQHPLTIKNMRDEEELLHSLTNAVTQFYTWFWKVAKVPE